MNKNDVLVANKVAVKVKRGVEELQKVGDDEEDLKRHVVREHVGGHDATDRLKNNL